MYFRIFIISFFLSLISCDAIDSYEYKKLNEEFDDDCRVLAFSIFDLLDKKGDKIAYDEWLLLSLTYHDLCWDNEYQPRYERKWFKQ